MRRRDLFRSPGCPILLTLMLAFLWGAPSDAAAQQQADGRPTFATRVVVAVPETFPDVDARALLIREPGLDVVALPVDEASVETLEMALLTLAEAEKRPRRPGQGTMIPITGYVVITPPSDERRRTLEGILSDLEHAEPEVLGTRGPARWVPLTGR